MACLVVSTPETLISCVVPSPVGHPAAAFTCKRDPVLLQQEEVELHRNPVVANRAIQKGDLPVTRTHKRFAVTEADGSTAILQSDGCGPLGQARLESMATGMICSWSSAPHLAPVRI